MADKKISALTASTTPLAGTEVLPIVQGGSTVKVSIADVTAGRAVATGNLTTTGTATISSNAAIGTTTLNVNANRNTLVLQGAWGGQVDINVGATNHAQFGSDNFDTGVSCRLQSADNIVFKVNSGTPIGYMTPNGFAPTTGKGIDFSANTHAPGMTSELLNDYEEGTWTPVVVPSSGSITTQTCSGQYTKIGRLVQVQFSIVLNDIGTASSISAISGLPFTSSNTDAQGSSATFEEGVTGFTWTFRVNKANTSVYITRYDNSTTIANSYTWRGSLTYTV
jgi:hypothetical protein